MRIGLLIISIGDFGQNGYYNTQEIGLAKELDKLINEIVIYKLVPENKNYVEKRLSGCCNTTLKLVPSKSYGSNGLINVGILDKTLDAIIFFSDTQIYVPKVYKWANKNGVKLFPYIGVIESHSTNLAKKKFMRFLFKRNLAVYQKCDCFVKTPTVKQQLLDKGVNNVTLTPVGLDLSLLHQNYEDTDKNNLKIKWSIVK